MDKRKYRIDNLITEVDISFEEFKDYIDQITLWLQSIDEIYELTDGKVDLTDLGVDFIDSIVKLLIKITMDDCGAIADFVYSIGYADTAGDEPQIKTVEDLWRFLSGDWDESDE